MWKYVLAWVPMVFIALANGALREGWYGKHLGALQAHQVSTVSGVVLFGVYIWAVVRLWRPASGGQAVIIGLVWLALMAAFELLLGHDVARGPWSSSYTTPTFSRDVYGWSSSCGSPSHPLSSILPVTHNFCFRASWGMLRTPFLSYIAKSNR